jgi:hypothetical protein
VAAVEAEHADASAPAVFYVGRHPSEHASSEAHREKLRWQPDGYADKLYKSFVSPRTPTAWILESKGSSRQTAATTRRHACTLFVKRLPSFSPTNDHCLELRAQGRTATNCDAYRHVDGSLS